MRLRDNALLISLMLTISSLSSFSLSQNFSEAEFGNTKSFQKTNFDSHSFVGSTKFNHHTPSALAGHMGSNTPIASQVSKIDNTDRDRSQTGSNTPIASQVSKIDNTDRDRSQTGSNTPIASQVSKIDNTDNNKKSSHKIVHSRISSALQQEMEDLDCSPQFFILEEHTPDYSGALVSDSTVSKNNNHPENDALLAISEIGDSPNLRSYPACN